MGIGTSIVLIAIGAILKFAVSASAHGFNIQTAGVILMVLGIVGLIISVLWMTIWANGARRTTVERRAVVRDREVV